MLFRRLKLRLFKRPIIIGGGRYGFTMVQIWCVVAACAAVGILISLIALLSKLQPKITSLAADRTGHLVTASINKAIKDHINDGSLSYEQLITLEKNATGEIAAITTDMAAINLLKAEIVSEIIDEVSNMEASDLNIPLGSVLGIDILSGRGPSIPFTVAALNSSSANFTNEFAATGINQSKHQIILEISVEIDISLPWCVETTRIGTDILIAETVVVGYLPDSNLTLDGMTG